MFSYYGSKSKIVDLYPPPQCDTVIEPFAGTARYALKYYYKDVIISDLYEPVYRIWKYLQQASKKDILDLPNIEYKQSAPKYLCKEERDLIHYCCVRGNSYPPNKAQKFNSWENDKKRIAESLYKIRDWEILDKSYSELDNIEATWFIDPPYQKMGYKYKHSEIDYNYLSQWCKSRIGQVIVCENLGADWLDFKPITEFTGAQKRNTEAIWSNMPTNYDNTQQTLF